MEKKKRLQGSKGERERKLGRKKPASHPASYSINFREHGKKKKYTGKKAKKCRGWKQIALGEERSPTTPPKPPNPNPPKPPHPPKKTNPPNPHTPPTTPPQHPTPPPPPKPPHKTPKNKPTKNPPPKNKTPTKPQNTQTQKTKPIDCGVQGLRQKTQQQHVMGEKRVPLGHQGPRKKDRNKLTKAGMRGGINRAIKARMPVGKSPLTYKRTGRQKCLERGKGMGATTDYRSTKPCCDRG